MPSAFIKHFKTIASSATAVLSLVGASSVFAANAVVIQDFDGGPGANILAPGGTLVVSDWANSVSGYSDNPALNFSAWAHVGDWWSFELTGAATVTIDVAAQNTAPNEYQPGFSLYASDADPFDGGTTGFLGETSTAGWGTPHSFNATGAVGSFGTAWMASGFGGNMLELLAYAVSGPSHDAAGTGWGEQIQTGVHDASVSALFESGIIGAVGDGFATVTMIDLQPGWYTLFVGGTDHSSSGGLFDVTVSAVPLPGALYLLGSVLAGCGLFRRRRLTA